MAVIAEVCTPYVQGADLNLLAPLPIGDLIDVTTMTTPPDGVSAVIAARFPVPASALAFLIDNNLIGNEFPSGVEIGLEPPYSITGAVTHEGLYLEPTVGQIWPR